MKLPKTNKVGPHVYKTKFPYKFDDMNNPPAALCDPIVHEYRISDIGQDDSELMVNWWHEVFHSIDKVTGRNIFEQNEQTESYLECFTQVFVAMMIDNKLLNMNKFDL